MQAQHSKECIDQAEKRFRAIEDYEKKYPNHCRNCNGSGGFFSTYDPSPAGVSLSPGVMYDFDPCERCFGLCPQCAKPLEKEDSEQCLHCEWSYQNSAGKPEPSECFCYDEFVDMREFEIYRQSDYLQAMQSYDTKRLEEPSRLQKIAGYFFAFRPDDRSLYLHRPIQLVFTLNTLSQGWQITPHSYMSSKTTWRHGNAYLGRLRVIW